MSNKRRSAFDVLSEQTEDLSDFKPAANSMRPSREQVRDITAFPSREAMREEKGGIVAQQTSEPEHAQRRPRTFRTGRNSTLTIRASEETINLFYSLADRRQWKVSETFEEALKALAASLSKG